MLSTINPAQLDRIGDIQTGTEANVKGEITVIWSTSIANVRSKLLAPLRYSEDEETKQQTSVERNSWLIRKELRNIVPKDTSYLVLGKRHMITSVRDYKGSRNYIVIDTEYRDSPGV